MKLSLFHKIFSAFMVMIAAAVVVTALTMYYSANWRFSEYVLKVEMAALDDLAAAFGALYLEKRSWEQFRENPGFWVRFVSLYVPEMPGYHPPPPPPGARSADGPGEARAPMDGPLGHPENGYPPQYGGKGPLPVGPPRMPLPPPRREAIGPRVALFDENKLMVAGPPGFPVRGYVLRPLTTGDQTVGWLGLMPLRHGSHPMEAAFVREQAGAMGLACFCVFALAGLISFFLSKHILSPVRKMTEAARELSVLNFRTHIDVQTRDELGLMADAFNCMAKALERNETLRKQWTADVAHELRTPLAILRGEIEAMQDGVREINAERLASLHEEINRIGGLVDDLHALFVADSESLVRRKGRVQPLAILKEVIGSFETRLARAGIQLQAHSLDDQDAVIMGDADSLARLFSNLIENSVRYTDAPGVLRINHYCSLRTLTMVFEDSPPGVPSEALERIFDRLYRVDRSRSRASGGSGLGLSICKEIVIGHGGAVRASHSSLGGLLVSIEFELMNV
ncbi:MAG: ATP-binding protein [Pseudomonadota bacterium]